ncbi:Zinc finger y-chromosomal protein 1 [Plakobranchus ocellatus]|uniref:Zinc finger y-chromosomal protein 1 n=1 Tax=Plakobranchus ocellatus TaxID=259542 RepID=A0AAV4B607_9GAST|nr:Zinc finger y-chromosomal protein 1 [Plakobranchus ocellatus]
MPLRPWPKGTFNNDAATSLSPRCTVFVWYHHQPLYKWGCERSDISKHMLIHQEPKHACERCGKTFRHIKNKELHVKRHYGQRDYKCGVCDFFGYTFTDIRKHIERKHQDIKTLTCDKCGRHFRNEMALKEHMQSCNVMMIEQVLAIPTSGGRTSQATIRIPTHHLSSDLSSLGGMVALDPAGTAGLVGDGNVADGSKDATQGVSIMVTSSTGDQHLRIVQTAMDEDEDEEEDLEEEEDQEENGDGSSMQQAMHIIDGTIMKEGVSVQHMLGKGTPQLIASNSNIDLTQTHQIEQDQHYVVASDIHLISCSSDTNTATSIITTAGEGCQEHQGHAVLSTKYEDSLVGREKEEIPGEGHITSVEGGSEAMKVEGKPEALVSMAEWSATSQDRAFSNTDNSQVQQDRLLVS